MSIYELRDLAILIMATLIPSAALSIIIVKLRPSWSNRRALLSAALPIPSIIWALCLVLFVSSVFATKAQCGVDACGMAMMASTVVAAYALIAFLLGVVMAWLVRRIMQK